MAFTRSGVRSPSPPFPGSRGRCASGERTLNCYPLAGIAQLVEHNLAKVGVAGSSPVSRSQGRQETQEQVAVIVAGWSSLVARRAHNPEVVGSNPTPAIGGQAVRRTAVPVRGALLVPPSQPSA